MPPSPEFDPEQSGILPKKYPDLQQSRPVEQAVNHVEHLEHKPIPNDPDARISLYLQKLEQRHSVFQPEQDDPADEVRRQQARDRFAASFAIKPEDIPEGYFANQQRLARERGYGEIEITPDMRQQMAEAIRQDQITSLSQWIDYMRGPDVNYPTWFKYFTLRNATQLSGYDKERQAFRQRSAGTTAPFPDLNREALAYVYDNLANNFQDLKADDPKLQQLLQGANFAKLYAYAIQRAEAANPESHKEIIGSWKKYDQNSDAKSLSDSLQGHNTGWCTAGESTAEMQLQGGDFYVYYSRDDQGQDTIPRIAIRMEQGEVAEIRGVNKDQELEPELIDTAMAKAQQLPGGDRYFKKAEDMRRLTEIEHKHHQGEPLSTDELRFLYEVGAIIESFGYNRDPRIEELQFNQLNLENFVANADEIHSSDTERKRAEKTLAFVHIENKIKQDQPLSLEDLRFLYELDGDDTKDTYTLSQRRNAILITRNSRLDLEKVFNHPLDDYLLISLLQNNQHLGRVEHYLSHFNNLDAGCAQKLIDIKQSQFLVDNLSHFNNLTKKTAKQLINSGHLPTVLSHFNKFNDLTENELAQIALTISPMILAFHLDHFKNLNLSIAHALIMNGYEREVFYDAKAFGYNNSSAIVDKFLDLGKEKFLLNRVDDLPRLNARQAARLAKRLSSDKDLDDRNWCLYVLIINGHAKEVADQLQYFQDIPWEIAIYLIEAGQAKAVRQQLHSVMLMDQDRVKEYLGNPE